MYILITGEPAANLRPNLKIVRFSVIEKHETIARIDLERAKRAFRFKLQAELPWRSPKNPQEDARIAEVDELTPMFRTFEGCIQYLDVKKDEWREILAGHDDRQQRLAGTLYQTIPV